MFETISVVGLGYIGLPTAAVLAANNKKVCGVDVNPHVVSTINAGQIHIVEPDLANVVEIAVASGKLKASLHVAPADAFLITVPTPFKDEYEPDLSFIEAAAASIAPVLQKGNLVILESTSPVGTTEQLAEWLSAARPDLTFPNQVGDDADVNIGYCPERVLPGQVLRELKQNDRIIGGLSERCSEKCTMLYNYFVDGNCIKTNARTAELAKLTENSFRDVNIAFANELSILCEQFGVNVWELIELANRHPRVNILSPGTGVGGHCIAVDPWFIVYAGKENARLIRAAREINDHKTEWVISQIVSEIEKFVVTNNRQPKVACMGLSFKPNIDDLRGSPALHVYQSLVASGVAVCAVEPNLVKHDNIILTDFKVALTEADIKVFLVGHNEFKNHGVDGIILDFCGVIDSQVLK